MTDEPCRLLQPSILRRTPHDYQKLAIQAIRDWWNEVPGPRGAIPAVVRIPTGGGKTLVAVHFALDHVVSRDEPRRVLWLTHRSELRGGAIEAFENNCAYGRHEGVYLAEYGPQGQRWDGEHDPKIIVASIPSVTGKREVRPEFDVLITGMNFDLVVVDECHHAATAETWQRIIDRVAQPFQRDGQLVHPRLLGLSATPFPREGISFFRREIFSISMKKLIEEGFLSRPAISVVSCGNATTIDDAIVGVLEAAEWGKTLVFTPSVDVARSLARRVTGSTYVDGNMDIGLRDRAFHGFKKGATHTLFNYGVATEGTDLPLVETVLFARATKSPVLFQQMLGRGLRGKRNGGTELCNLLFFSGPQMQEAAEVIGGWEEMIGALAESADETLERLQAMYVPPRVEPKPRPPLPTSSLHFLLVSDELPAALLGYWEQSNGMPPFLPHFMDDEELERWMTQCKAPTVDVPPASRWLRNEVVLRFVMQAAEPWTYRPIPPQTDAARFALACSIGESIDELLDRVESLIEQLASLRETDRALESQLDDIVENLCARMGSRALPQIGRRAVGAASNPLATNEGEHEPLVPAALDAFGELAARMEKSLFERTTNYEALRLELDEKWLATEVSPQLPIDLKRRLWVSTLHLANHFGNVDLGTRALTELARLPASESSEEAALHYNLAEGFRLNQLPASSEETLRALTSGAARERVRVRVFDKAFGLPIGARDTDIPEAFEVDLRGGRRPSSVEHARLLGTMARSCAFYGHFAQATELALRARRGFAEPHDLLFNATLLGNIEAERARLSSVDRDTRGEQRRTVLQMLKLLPRPDAAAAQFNVPILPESTSRNEWRKLFHFDLLLRYALWVPECRSRQRGLVERAHDLLGQVRGWLADEHFVGELAHPVELVFRHAGELAQQAGVDSTPFFDLALKAAPAEAERGRETLARIAVFTKLLRSGESAHGMPGSTTNPTFEYR